MAERLIRESDVIKLIDEWLDNYPLPRHVEKGLQSHEELLAYIADAPTIMVSTVNNWVSVKDKLPNPYELVLIYMPDKKLLPKICEGFISEDGSWLAGWCVQEPGEVVAWQEMPDPPSHEIWLEEN